MEQVWYTTNLNTIPANEPDYVIGHFDNALFTVEFITAYAEQLQY